MRQVHTDNKLIINTLTATNFINPSYFSTRYVIPNCEG